MNHETALGRGIARLQRSEAHQPVSVKALALGLPQCAHDVRFDARVEPADGYGDREGCDRPVPAVAADIDRHVVQPRRGR